MYLCTKDGGQWNVPVEVEHNLRYGLRVVRGLTSDLVGWIGTDGHCYTLCRQDELFETEQVAGINNVIPIR